MNALLHALNIGTMATWVSVAGFGSVGLAVPIWHQPLATVQQTTQISLDDITVSQDSIEGTQGDSEDEAQEATAEQPETLEAPPEISPLPELAPLPEVPDLAPLPEVAPQPDAVALPKPKAKPAPTPAKASATKKGGSATARPTGAGQGGTGNGGIAGGKAMTASEADRVSKGNIPRPSYPANARRAGIEGTTKIEFIIDYSGSVISATVVSSSGNSELDAAARSAVLRGKFPSGATVIKKIKPITFELRK